MSLKTETRHAGEFMVSEANGARSREAITVLSGQNLIAGAVLGTITASGKYVEYDPTNSDGSETAVAILHDAVDATGGDAPGVGIVRDAEFNAAEVTWFTDADAGEIATGTAELALKGIVGR